MTFLRQMWAIQLPDERRRSLYVVALLMASSIVEMLSVGLVVPLLALMTSNKEWLPGVVRARSDWLESLSPSEAVLLLMFGLVLVYVSKGFFLLFVSYWQSRHVKVVQAQVSRRLFAAVLGQPWSFHLQQNSAAIVHVVEETRAFSQACTDLLLVISETMVGSGLLLLLMCIEPLGAAIVAGVVALALWLLNHFVRPRSRRWAEARHRHTLLLRRQVQEGLTGVKEVKVRGCEDEFISNFRIHSDAVARMATFQWLVEQTPRPLFETLSIATLFLLTVVMIWDGKPVQALVPVLGLYATVAFRMLPSINQATIAIQRLRHAQPMITSLRQHLALEQSLPPHQPSAPITFKTCIEVRNLNYRYPGTNEDALQNIDITISHGTAIGLVGSSGAGKSTLLDVLLGLLPPASGRVLVDGISIMENLPGWQRIVGYVPQSIYLVDASIRRNVAFGVHENSINDDAVLRALETARLDEFVRTLPLGVESIVGERGVRLSGGQRQRLAIARALYHDPQVLVLDEATSALDIETEREVKAAVETLHGTKTLIVVAHRLDTVAGCDVLYRLEGGKIVRSGSFDEVVECNSSR